MWPVWLNWIISYILFITSLHQIYPCVLFARYFLHGPRDGSIPPPIDLEEDDDDESKIENSISEQQTSANVKVGQIRVL